MAEVHHTALTGETVALRGPGLNLSGTWSGSAAWRSGWGSIGFQTGRPSTALTAMVKGDHPDFRWSQEYSYEGGTLRLGSSRFFDPAMADPVSGRRFEETQWVADWEGQAYSLFTFHLTQVGEPSDLASWFEHVSIRESREGIAVTPRVGTGLLPVETTMTTEIDLLGVLEIHPKQSVASNSVPAWPGTRVLGGELYKDHIHAGGDSDGHEGSDPSDLGGEADGAIYWFTLVSGTAIALIRPLEVSVDTAYLSRLANLEIEWLPT